MRLKFNPKYFFVFVTILVTEVLIAVFVNDQYVRPFMGDVLVVLLLFALVRAFWEPKNAIFLAVGILLLSYLVEFGQYFQLVSRLGVADSEIATIVIGTSFDKRDLLAYTFGFIMILVEIGREHGFVTNLGRQ